MTGATDSSPTRRLCPFTAMAFQPPDPVTSATEMPMCTTWAITKARVVRHAASATSLEPD
ncbi:hypothetical protein LX15_004983 [Streptoalloteichus tenebrarius]|uniref:Uncharacterized protein n=1 Tax=Streptoalloteichus tenebrarius (strain ATCC 17920 / DSM 40477 / JCM 4838 / CBS 697.72 / NBRC 16177 / NCIMB 11028 / NRRL B-12390 / A12253. 1 / ISP 5477) TaxID=1933 RepID=A0ABT1I0E0_STRSD|nr:hypothetical protein [Streptoalloteichus tenebrarius]